MIKEKNIIVSMTTDNYDKLMDYAHSIGEQQRFEEFKNVNDLINETINSLINRFEEQSK
jgi:hypothetical protein